MCTTNQLPRKRLLSKCVIILLCVAVIPANADTMAKVWRRLYDRVYPGVEAPWLGREDAIAWVQGEREKVEPILLSIIRGDDPEIQWSAGVAVARYVPSPAICELLCIQMRKVLDRATDGLLIPNSIDERGLVNMLDILAQERREEARTFVLEIAAHPKQSSLVFEHCLLALQKVGIQDDVEPVRKIAARHVNEDIDRLAALTEKMLDARASGRDIFANAEAELRLLTKQYLHAVETEDAKEYIALHHYGFRRQAKEAELQAKVFEHPEMGEVIEALRRIAGRESFEIHPDVLRASLIIEGRFQLGFAYEVEGWRIGVIQRIGP